LRQCLLRYCIRRRPSRRRDQWTNEHLTSARAPARSERTLAVEPIEVLLPRSRECGALARRLVERHFGPRASATALDDVKLVVSELVDNAYLHGEGEIRLTMRADGRAAHVEVVDQGQGAAIEIRHTQPNQGDGPG
jgi:hypothetical protein